MISDKKFGFTFFLLFFIASIFFYYIKISLVAIIFFIVSLIFLILALSNSALLSKPKYYWIKLGEIMGFFVSPVVMALIYFGVIFPTKIFVFLLKKDLMFLNSKKTYWKTVDKDNNIINFKDQF